MYLLFSRKTEKRKGIEKVKLLEEKEVLELILSVVLYLKESHQNSHLL